MRRIVAAVDFLPPSTQFGALFLDIRKASPDDILVWGRPEDPSYTALKHTLMLEYPRSASEKIVDPVLGEVGIVQFTGPQ